MMPASPSGGSAARTPAEQKVQVWFGRPLPTAVLPRAELGPGTVLPGPAIVVQMDTTTVVNPGWAGRVDAAGNLVLERR